MATGAAPAAAIHPERAATTAADVPLDAVESTVDALLAADKRALKLAADLPLLFRAPVTVNGDAARFGGRLSRGRWGSRHLTRLYVETHVRRQLDALRASLRLELLGTSAPGDRARLQALETELATRVPPLLGWRRLVSLLTRVPALAAAVPVVWTASVLPLESASFGSVGEALLVLGLTALGVWVLVVWPAVKLGFRVKRAILAGGRDLAHPFLHAAGEVRWRALEGADVYAAEDAAFAALGRRKPAEPPLDLLLSFVPYVAFALLGLIVVALADAARSGFEGLSWDALGGSWLVLVIVVLPFAFVRNAWRNHRSRLR